MTKITKSNPFFLVLVIKVRGDIFRVSETSYIEKLLEISKVESEFPPFVHPDQSLSLTKMG